MALRGVAKERREAISRLPGHPFQMIINFQIPGDPPVSIVTFFALPVDLRQRHSHDPDIDKFIRLFEQFIRLPSSEDQRLATWGIIRKPGFFDRLDHELFDSQDEESFLCDLEDPDESKPQDGQTRQNDPNEEEILDGESLRGSKTSPNGSTVGRFDEERFSRFKKRLDRQANQIAQMQAAEDDSVASGIDRNRYHVPEEFQVKNGKHTSQGPASGGWIKLPSDITWPDPFEPGALPPTDFRNMRFKLTPAVTEGKKIPPFLCPVYLFIYLYAMATLLSLCECPHTSFSLSLFLTLTLTLVHIITLFVCLFVLGDWSLRPLGGPSRRSS